MYKIGIFAQMNRISVKALRHYEEIGLFKPARVDAFTGYRYYSSDQLPLLHQIISLKQIGFSLEEIKASIHGQSFEVLLLNKKEFLSLEIDRLRQMLLRVNHTLDTFHGENKMKYEVIIKPLPEVLVASMRRMISNYDAFFEIVPPMGDEMRRLHCECREPPYCFTIYHDGEYKAENIDVEICEAVTELKEDSQMISFKKIESVPTAACVLHKGPYASLRDAYAALTKWIEENQYEINGKPRESYIDGIWNKESEEEWLTEVQIPIRRLNDGI